MLDEAKERNKIALPKVEAGYGVQLPPEKFCLTGVGWSMQKEWDEEVAEDERFGLVGMERSASQQQQSAQKKRASAGGEDEAMGGMEAGDEDEEGAGRMEDVFGEEAGGDVAMGQD